MNAPHVPAAFINALAEEGTREELIEWLQKLWNENCELTARRSATRSRHQSSPDIVERLRLIMPSSLNDAIRTMEDAAQEIERLRDVAAESLDRMSELQYEAGMYKSLYENAVSGASQAAWMQVPPAHCACAACNERPHASDCAVHNAPALPIGPCDCTIPSDHRG